MRACRLGVCASTGALLPERTKPSAMLHSKVAMLSAEHAVRTRFTARISSDVSITTMGVEELMRTLRRSSPSVIFCDADAVQFRCTRDASLRLKSGYAQDDTGCFLSRCQANC